MKIQNTIILILIGFNIILIGNAQNLNLTTSDGSVIMPLDNTTSANIDSQGDINVTTSDSSVVIGSNLGLQPVGTAPGISFSVIANGTTTADINTTITNEAVYCDKSGLWTGLITSNPPTNYVTTLTDTVSTNGTTYSLTCANTFGITTNSASVTNVTTVLNPVVSISANPTQVALSGDSSVVSWSVTNAPVSCTFTGDWPTATGVLTPSNFPPTTFTISNITTTKNLSVICDNSAVGDSGLQTIQITIAGASTATWPSCSGAQSNQAAILGGNEDRTILANNSSVGGLTDGTYNQLYGTATPSSAPFPVGYNNKFEVSLTRGQYVAAQFNSGSPNTNSRFSFTTPGNFTGPIPTGLTFSISECPGDFNVHLGQSTCIGGGVNGSLYWSDVVGANAGFYCVLQKNTVYYLNMVHALPGSNNSYTTSSCGSSYCGLIATPVTVQ